MKMQLSVFLVAFVLLCCGLENVVCAKTERQYIINEDFEGEEYVVGMAPPQDKGLSYKGCGTAGSVSGITVCEASNGDKFLSISSQKDCQGSVYKTFDIPILDGEIIIETKVRPSSLEKSRNGGDAIRTVGYFGPTSDENVTYGIAHYMWGRIYGTVDGAGEFNYGDPFNDYSTDENGFFSIKYVLSKDENGFWYAQVYNKNDLMSTPIIKKFVSGSGILGCFMPASIFPTDDIKAQFDRVDISEFKIYVNKQLQETDISENSYVEFHMNQKLIPETVIPDNFEVYNLEALDSMKIKDIFYFPQKDIVKVYVDGDGNVGNLCRIDGSDGVSSVISKGYLSSEYICKLDDVSVAKLSFLDNYEISELSRHENVTVSVKLVNSSMHDVYGLKVFFVSYEGNTMKDVEMRTVDIGADDIIELTKAYDNHIFKKGERIKIIILKNFDSLDSIYNSGGAIRTYE